MANVNSATFKRFLPAQPGTIVTPDGEVIGEHHGLMYYTLGQRQGLGIGGLKHHAEAPWFVIDKRLDNNQLVVAQGHQNDYLLKHALTASQLHWVAGAPPAATLPAAPKSVTASRMSLVRCRSRCPGPGLLHGGTTGHHAGAIRGILSGRTLPRWWYH
ncbi:MAG: tRNA methyl transferase PRC-barrel domain-containing protein [Thiolinea sp.]